MSRCWKNLLKDMAIKYSKEKLQNAVKNSNSIRDVIRYLGGNPGSGGVFHHVKRKLKEYEIDFSHFLGQGWNLGNISPHRRTPEEILILNSSLTYRIKADRLRRAMLESGVEYRCVKCGLSSMWQGKKIVLQVDHINEDWRDNRKDNLRFSCPNCHSQR